MRHHNDGQLLLVVEATQKFQNVRGRFRIEVPRRFVGKKEARTGDQRSRYRRPLHFAPREFVRAVTQTMRQADKIEKLLRLANIRGAAA